MSEPVRMFPFEGVGVRLPSRFSGAARRASQSMLAVSVDAESEARDTTGEESDTSFAGDGKGIAGVVKSVNTGDLKSPGLRPLRVQVPPPALPQSSVADREAPTFTGRDFCVVSAVREPHGRTSA